MEFLDKVKQMGKVALDKGKEAGKFTKTKIEIAALESEIKDLKVKIGDIVFKQKIDTSNSEIANYVDTINKKLEEINKKNEELKKD